MPKKTSITFLVLLFLFILYAANKWTNNHINAIVNSPSHKITTKKNKKSSENSKMAPDKIRGTILRVEKEVPREEYTINTIYADNIQLATFKKTEDKIFEIQGNIPDGKVKFFDENAKSHGYEHYKNNKRTGEYKEFFSNGETKRKAIFSRGRVVINKEYFPNGSVRMEENYEEASSFSPFEDETGAGKGTIYYPNGNIKLQWERIDGQPGFKKLYDRRGNLIKSSTYDSFGNLLKSWDKDQASQNVAN